MRRFIISILFTCSHAYADTLPSVPVRCSESQVEEIDDVCFESTSDDLYKTCLETELKKQCGAVTVAGME